MSRRITIGALACAVVLTGAASAQAAGRGYNNIPTPLPGNVPSYGFEAYSLAELGNQITFAAKPTDKPANNTYGHATVLLSSWGCQSGHWYSGDCQTTGNAKFSVPMTLNVYAAPIAGSLLPGALIESVQSTFAIPYRPSASAKCENPAKWYDKTSKT